MNCPMGLRDSGTGIVSASAWEKGEAGSAVETLFLFSSGIKKVSFDADPRGAESKSRPGLFEKEISDGVLQSRDFLEVVSFFSSTGKCLAPGSFNSRLRPKIAFLIDSW